MKTEELKKILCEFDTKLSNEVYEFLNIQDKIDFAPHRKINDTDETLEEDLTFCIEELFRISQTIKSLKSEIEMEEIKEEYFQRREVS